MNCGAVATQQSSGATAKTLCTCSKKNYTYQSPEQFFVMFIITENITAMIQCLRTKGKRNIRVPQTK